MTSDMIGGGPVTEKRKERVVKKSVVIAECLMVRQVLHSDWPTADTLRCLVDGPSSGWLIAGTTRNNEVKPENTIGRIQTFVRRNLCRILHTETVLNRNLL